jgi:adenylate kinase family enzyme
MGVESIPLDISITPRVVVQGLPKSGKSTLCKRVSEITGAVHLEMEKLIEGFVDRDSSFAAKIAHKLKVEGRDLDDLLLVQLIQKRVGMADCASRGWILEGFPQTRSQAILMAKKSLLPSNVIMVDIPIEEVYKRTEALVKDEFGCDRTILKRRLDYTCKNTPSMVYFF